MTVSDDTAGGHQRRVFSSMSTGISSTIVVSILGAISVRAMTTRLGATAFGIFVLVQAYVSLAQTFTDLGLAQVLQRDIARGDKDERLLLSHAMGLRVTLGLLAIPVAGALGLLIYSGQSTTMRIGLVLLLFSIPFAVAQEVAAAHFSAQLRNSILAVGSIMQQVVFVGLVIFAVSLHKSVVFCLGAALIGAIASSIFTTAMARREVSFTPSYNRVVWFSMLKTSTPIGVAYIIGLLYFKADTLILSFLATTKQIGFYGVAYSVVAVFLVFPSTFTRTFLPSMVRATKETIEETVHSALRYYAIGGTFGATAIMICGPTVVRIVAGSHFGASVPPMRILGAGLIFIFLGSGISSVCISRGFGNKIFVVSLVGLVLNVVLNVLAIPKFGINGAATATFVCEIISLAMFVRLVRRDIQVRIRVLRPLAKPFTAGVLTCAVLAPIYLRGDLRIIYGLILMPVTCIVYFVTLAILRGFPPELVAYVRKSIVKK